MFSLQFFFQFSVDSEQRQFCESVPDFANNFEYNNRLPQSLSSEPVDLQTVLEELRRKYMNQNIEH